MKDNEFETLVDNVANALSERETSETSRLERLGEIALVVGVAYVSIQMVNNVIYRRKLRRLQKTK